MIRIYSRQVPWAREVELYILKDHPNGDSEIAKPIELTFEPLREGQKTTPTLVFQGVRETEEFLREMVSAIKDAGYDRVDATGKELAAVRFHLEDMRKLVFERLC